MINLFPRSKSGAVTLIFTVVLLVLSTLIIIFAASFNITQDKLVANFSRNNQAFEAAQAGLEFGIPYLQQNSAAILANPVNGFIPSYSNASTSNVALANGSQFTVTYSNPVAYSYDIISISSTGTSDDGTSIRVVSQLVKLNSILANPPNVPLTGKTNIDIGGSSQIINTITNSTVQSGGSVAITGSAKTVLSTGTSSTSSLTKSDVTQNISSINSMSQNDFFATYFGVNQTTAKNSIAHYYTNSNTTNYSSTLNGMTGTSIWIDQTSGKATINGGTIGSSTNPVILIVNGQLDITGNVVIYGIIYAVGQSETDVTGTVNIYGALITADQVTLRGNTQVTYSPTVLSNLKNQTSTSYYAKVPGSWKDF